MSEPDSPPPRTPVVAVVGTCEESTGSFLSLLVRGDADVDRPMPAPGEVLRWTLDTKYYVADAACVFHPLPGAYLDARGGEPQVAAARDRSLALETAANAEALVLCYDPLDERAFAAVASFAGDVAEAAGDEDRPEVRVLVGLYRDAESVTTRDPGLKKARDPAETWAASRGYEALAAGAARDAAERYRTSLGRSSSGGERSFSGISSGMDKSRACAARLPASTCRSTAAAWHDTSRALNSFSLFSALKKARPTSARASSAPRDTSPSPSSATGANVETQTSCSSLFPPRHRAKTDSAAARSAASVPKIATRNAESRAGSGSVAPSELGSFFVLFVFVSAANKTSWFSREPFTSSPRHRSALARTGALFAARSPSASASNASSTPALTRADWFATRLAVFTASSRAASSAATDSSGFSRDLISRASPSDASSVTSSSAQSRFAAFCADNGGGATPAGTAGDLPSMRSGIFERNELSRKNVWFEGDPRSRLLHSSRQSCTMTPPSAAPSSRTMLKHRSNAPSNATSLRRSSLCRVRQTSSNRVSLRITSRSVIMSIRRATPVGLDITAPRRKCAQGEASAASSCTAWYRT
mmetsp:Transcript_8011/g.33482  ORF Transcript_8011/g.33482 Transcript_8011/m.33482 type:complete len:589 (+) Transcript_8011:49-1815(+)